MGNTELACRTVIKTIECDVDIAADRFWVVDQNGDEVQVRLEPNGTVYLCYTTRNRRTIESQEVSWVDFMTAFQKFVNEIG